MTDSVVKSKPKEIKETIEYLRSAHTLQEAFICIAELFEKGEKHILVQKTGASATQFDIFNKRLRKVYYCTRHRMGFVVHNFQRSDEK